MAGISKKRVKNKDGKETIRYVITYRDITGKQHTYGNYKKESDAKNDLSKFQNLKTVTNNNIKFGKIIEIFMEKVRRKYAKNTVKAYESYLKYLEPLFEVKYTRLNSLLLQELFDRLEKEKPYTAHNILDFCKAAVNYNIEKKVINKYNVFEELDVIKRPSRNLNHLELKDILMVLDKCKQKFSRWYVMLFVLFGAGLRIGEVIALETQDFRENYLDINKQFTADELKYKPKTDKSNRRAYLFNYLVALLNEHIKTLPTDAKLLFPNEAGNYINPSNFRNRVWKPLLNECGINYRVRLHDIRGSYTDVTLSSGISGKFTQNQLGHEDWETTYNIYAQNNSDSINNALGILEKLFTEKCEPNVSQKAKCKVYSFQEELAKRQIKKEL